MVNKFNNKTIQLNYIGLVVRLDTRADRKTAGAFRNQAKEGESYKLKNNTTLTRQKA